MAFSDPLEKNKMLPLYHFSPLLHQLTLVIPSPKRAQQSPKIFLVKALVSSNLNYYCVVLINCQTDCVTKINPGEVSSTKSPCMNKQPSKISKHYSDFVHYDIYFGTITGLGGIDCTILFADRATLANNVQHLKP